MKPIRLVAVAAILAGGCYSQDSTYAQSTMPEPQQVMGPPGGDMDPGWGYGSPGDQPAYDPGMQADASAAVDGYAGDQPTDPNAMAPVTDAEIDQTLQPYGQWVEDEDYGRVWRPDATVVGVDFTPYETCGTWVWTDYGWTYSCDWGWGWLPFHYGRWAWCDGYWGWQPGYEWGPAWVDWRSGGGYVGWRPSAPLVRDHRGEHQGPTFHDHRTQHEANWRFASASDFGKPHIRSHTFGDIAEGLRVTAPVTRPTVRPMTQPIRAASIMRARVMGARANGIGVGAAAPARPGSTFGNARPTYGGYRTPYEGYRSPYQGYRQPAPYRAPQPSYQPYRAPLQAYQPPYRGPSTYQPPVRGPSNTYRPPAPTYTRPPTYGGGGSYGGSRPSPSFGGSSSFGGSRPSPSFGGGGSFGGSHSSGGSFGGGGHSSGGSFGGGHSSGGGGGHFGGGGGGHHR